MPVLSKWSKHIKVVLLTENVGLSKATNIGVKAATSNSVLVVNDDNVFDLDWDLKLAQLDVSRSVYSINQVEPRPSIYKWFVISNLGETPSDFDLEFFWEATTQYNSEVHTPNSNGSSLPFLISRENYLMVGGWDESYPGPWVVDWDFFLKCNMAGLTMQRVTTTHFYHFGSIATTSPEKREKEIKCHEYARDKWLKLIAESPDNNLKFLLNSVK